MNLYHIPFLSNKFRVRETIMGDNRSKFYPQWRFCLIWRNISDSSYGIQGVANFKDLEEAEKYLFKMTMKHRSKQIKKLRSHPFDPVFHKLKQTKTKRNDEWEN